MKKYFLLASFLANIALLTACDVVDGMIANINQAPYAVKYDSNGANGGSVPVNGNYYGEGDVFNASGNTGNLIRINDGGVSYRITGWNTQNDGGGIQYGFGDLITVTTSDLVLYAAWTPYVLRDIGPGGGLIFYDKGSYSVTVPGDPSWRYLESITDDLTDGTGNWCYWGTSNLAVETINWSLIGYGMSNTNEIMAKDSYVRKAAAMCHNLTLGGYNDWFLPAMNELNLMYSNLKTFGIGNFNSLMYWSSTEVDATRAYGIDFTNNAHLDYLKTSGGHVRAIREF